jgi:low affinity Fe/Cu permease
MDRVKAIHLELEDEIRRLKEQPKDCVACDDKREGMIDVMSHLVELQTVMKEIE